MTAPLVSVVVRFCNERRWLEAVLSAVRAQRCSFGMEIVAADNASSDGSRAIAQHHADVMLDIVDYRPGAALNSAIAQSSGDIIAVLSAHALPSDRDWLEQLVAPLTDPRRLAVYGAQIYPLTSRFLDKRDLDIFSDQRPREETVDSDFWNANSAFLRTVWERVPFEESVVELEDHYWTKRQLPAAARSVRFEPTAAVYHYSHEDRNDRTFLAPARPSDDELIAHSRRVLEQPDQPWPAVMSAGLTLGSLSHLHKVRLAVPTIGRVLVEHPDFDVRWRMAHVLGRIGGAEAVPYLVTGLGDRSFYARDESAWALARLGPMAVPGVLAAIAGLAPCHVPFAALALGLSGDRSAEKRALDLLEECLRCGDRGTARDAVYFVGELADIAGVSRLLPRLIGALSAENDLARAAAWSWGMVATGAMSPTEPEADVIRDAVRGHVDANVRAEAVIAIGRVARAAQSSELINDVVRGLLDPIGRVRYATMQTLRLAAHDRSVPAANAAAAHGEDADFGVRFERNRALKLGEICV